MTTAQAYREIAAEQRRRAEKSNLIQVRHQMIEAAERWEWLADEYEASQSGLMALFEPIHRAA